MFHIYGKRILIYLILFSFLASGLAKMAYGAPPNRGVRVSSELESTWEQSSTEQYKRKDNLTSKDLAIKQGVMMTAAVAGIAASAAGTALSAGAMTPVLVGAISLALTTAEFIRECCFIAKKDVCKQAISDVKSYRIIKDAGLFLKGKENKGRFDEFFEKYFLNERSGLQRVQVAKIITNLNKEGELGTLIEGRGKSFFTFFDRKEIRDLVLREA